MPEPEISHRCPACGAAFRAGAQFCPQCGNQLGKPAPQQPEETPRLRASEQELKTTPLPPTANLIETPKSVAQGAEDKVAVAAAADGLEKPLQPVVMQDESSAKRHRVRDAARGMVQENVRPRVEKLRQASSVVLEEVAIDPSLRFILIAVLLFIIALVLLFLSFIK